MTYPAAALQIAIYDKIKATGGLAAVGVYDSVRGVPAFPYITIGDGQFLDDGDTCEGDRYEGFVDLQIWSRVVGNIEAKTLAGTLRDAIVAGLTITGWNALSITCRTIRHFMDSDGLTARAVLTFRFILEPA